MLQRGKQRAFYKFVLPFRLHRTDPRLKEKDRSKATYKIHKLNKTKSKKKTETEISQQAQYVYFLCRPLRFIF